MRVHQVALAPSTPGTEALGARQASQSFYSAYLRCMEQRPLPENRFQMLLVPAVVCGVFSVELGLKALLLAGNRRASGHALDKLFRRLPDNQQAVLIRDVGLSPLDFALGLQAIANAFVEWRYIYEATPQQPQHLDSLFLEGLAKAVQASLSSTATVPPSPPSGAHGA